MGVETTLLVTERHGHAVELAAENTDSFNLVIGTGNDIAQLAGIVADDTAI
jgi:hypothetical protein